MVPPSRSRSIVRRRERLRDIEKRPPGIRRPRLAESEAQPPKVVTREERKLISNAKTVAAKTVAALVAIAALGLCLVSMVSAETTRQHLNAFTAGTSNGPLAVDSSGNV